jgi:glycosyltransferase involved in cell wall biosynthesis
MISLVIPVYNEVESLPLLHQKLIDVMDAIGHAWEVIYVDDGSVDGSTDVLTELQATDSHVGVILQRRNFGKSQALNTGFQLARGDVLITLDADLQDEPGEIPRMLAKLDEGYDVVSGWKQVRHDPLSKTIPSFIANRSTAMATGVRMHDMNSGFKTYRAEVVRKLHLYGDLHRYIPALAHYAGFKVTEIPVEHHKRQYGRSKYGPGRLFSGGLDLMTVVFINRFGKRPLHLLGTGGMLMLTAGTFINLWLSVEWLIGPERNLSDRPALILGVLLMLVGLQLLTVGLVAELIVSAIQRAEDPLNTVRSIYRPGSHESENHRSRIGD